MHRFLRDVDVGVVHTVVRNAEAEERIGVKQYTAFGLLDLMNHPAKRDMRKRVGGSVFLNATTDIAMRTCEPAFDDRGLGLARADLNALVVWLPERDIPLGPTLVEANSMPEDLDCVVRTERKVARDDGADARHGIPDECQLMQSKLLKRQTRHRGSRSQRLYKR